METAEVQSALGRVEDDMVVECFVIYMAAHGIDVWAVGGTYEWEHGGERVRGWASGCRGLFPRQMDDDTERYVCLRWEL